MKKTGNILMGPVMTGMCSGVLIAELLMWLIPNLAAYRVVFMIACGLLTLALGVFIVLRWWKKLPDDEPLPQWAASAWIGSTWGTLAFYLMQWINIIVEFPAPWKTLTIAAPVLGSLAGLLYGWCKTAFIAHSGR